MGEARGQGTGGETSLSAFGPKNGSGKGLETMKLWVGNSTPNLQDIPNSLPKRDTALDGGWDWPPGKGQTLFW